MGASWRGPDGDRRARAVLGWLILAAITAAALYLRLRDIGGTFLYMDNVHPPLRAVAVVRGELLPWRGEAVGFHFGMLQTWILVPLAAVAGSLSQLWVGSAVIHGLGAVPAGLAGRKLGGWPAGLVAALLYATWPMLVQHPQVGAWTYHAPVFTAIAAWAAAHALAGPSRVALLGLAAALAVAVHMHPFALAPALGVGVLTPRLLRVHGRSAVIQAVVLAALILAPMIVDNAQSVFGESGEESVDVILQDAAVSHARLLQESVLAAGSGWPAWLSRMVLLGLLLVPVVVLLQPARDRRDDPGPGMALWTASSYVAVAAIALILNYMRPSHAAPIFPLHGVALAWALLAVPAALARRITLTGGATALRWVLAGGLALAISLPWLDAPSEARRDQLSHLAVMDQVNATIAARAGDAPLVLGLIADAAVASNGEPSAYHADLWLRGAACPRTHREVLNTSPPPTAYVAATLTPAAWAAWQGTPQPILEAPSGAGAQLRVLPFDDIDAATSWMVAGCPLLDTWPGIGFGDAERTLGGLRTDREEGDKVTGEFQALCAARAGAAAPPAPATDRSSPPPGPAGEAPRR